MQRIVYVTSSSFKRAELDVLQRQVALHDGRLIAELFAFNVRSVRIYERLEIEIEKMVQAEVHQAYRQLRVPCIVEHAGLVFDDYRTRPECEQYPGGLTKPMWNALGAAFLRETRSAGRGAVARAVVGYCDGQKIYTFVGETNGRLADEPRGSRDFYWDTVFIPDNPDGTPGADTYAEIVDDPSRGLDFKVKHLSQSTKAICGFLEWVRTAPPSALWPDGL